MLDSEENDRLLWAKQIQEIPDLIYCLVCSWQEMKWTAMEEQKNEFDYPPKILITKVGLDGHDRGSRIVAAYLRDAGMEVVYTSPWQKIEAVVRLAMEEDVDVIGISSLATDHLIIPQLMERLREAGLEHIKVVVGGIIPKEEQPLLLESGVSQIFHPGVSREDIVETFGQLTQETRSEF